MSVCVKSYLSTHENILSQGLSTLVDHSIMLENTQLEVYFLDGDCWCRIFLDYTLSCNDLAEIASVFSGYWWCVSPTCETYKIVLSINFKDVVV